MPNSHNLQRFLSAQGDNIDTVLRELSDGKKLTHWMWYIFPQIQGLGRSATAELYAIQSKDEAIAYLYHPVLGPRLVQCTKTVNGHAHLTAEQIFGYTDTLKFRSCMTLFEKVASDKTPFTEALKKFYRGEPDARTLLILDEFTTHSGHIVSPE